ncbi:ATP synthase F0 subcomplex A subunit [Gillisia mitskevichiae]|uniref:ATP synthase subunit a n=1 Tax=Gillisia mitskevichiae TaxID=270921 RepID=A0A495PW86_9FLAO|nr:F0F1 ATP synthase subunit A [Gillisia mitskevichiae]RKS55425.1 ATP synthase F0 subcomplex A subunit [Gillisia mitskevichiae]
MKKDNTVRILLAVFIVLFSVNTFAQDHEVEHGENTELESHEGPGAVDTKEEVADYIDHHLQDSHSFNFFSDGATGEHYGFPLPVILWDNGLKAFSSSEFHHGETLAIIDGQHYKLYHNKIYKTNAEGTITYGEDGYPTNAKPLDFSITKNVLAMLLVSLLMFIIFKGLASSYKNKDIPSGFGRVLEPLVIYVRDDIAKPNIGPKYRKYMGFLLTVFFFILILNLLGLTPLGINVTGNIAVTFCLALATFFIVQFSGNKHYWKHIFWMPGVPIPMKIVLMPIEILGMLTKPFALMIRLFANMTAGHVVVMSLLGLIVIFQNWIAGPAFFGFTLFISIIELLVAFLQAYIFTLLSALYIGMAVEDHDHHPNDHSDDIPVI